MASNQRTPEQIRADIAASRHAMTVGLEGLVSEVHPSAIKNTVKAVAQDMADDAKQSAFDSVRRARGWFVDENGVRWDHVGTVTIAVLGVVTVVAAVSGLSKFARRGITK